MIQLIFPVVLNHLTESESMNESISESWTESLNRLNNSNHMIKNVNVPNDLNLKLEQM